MRLNQNPKTPKPQNPEDIGKVVCLKATKNNLAFYNKPIGVSAKFANLYHSQ